MKRLDYVIILMVFLVTVAVYSVYFIHNPILSSSAYDIEVRYQNNVVYKVEYKETLDQVVTLIAEDGVLVVTVVENDVVIFEQSFFVRDRGRTENIAHLLYNNVHMDYANCPDQYCLRMRVTSPFSPPIVCTNGVTIMMYTMEIEIII